MRYTKQQVISGAKIASIALALTLSLNFLAAATWQPPTQNPPQGDVPAPLNDGTGDQTKSGSLRVGGLTSDTVIVAPTSGLTPSVISELSINPDVFLWIGGKARADDFCLNADPSTCLNATAGKIWEHYMVWENIGNLPASNMYMDYWTIPAEADKIRIQAWGAGGGGKGCSGTLDTGGGGAGGYAEKIINLTSASERRITVRIGQIGQGGPSGTAATAGGNATLGWGHPDFGGAFMVVTGGAPGWCSGGDGTGGLGGTASGGDINITGGAGNNLWGGDPYMGGAGARGEGGTPGGGGGKSADGGRARVIIWW